MTRLTPSPTTTPTEGQTAVADTPVVFKRRTMDTVLISFGAVLAVALLVAGSLLTWGAGFSDDYVHDELASQNITFPPAAALEAEGRTDLLKYAGRDLTSGKQAEAYAGYIDGHLEDIADGATYAELGTPERESKAAVDAAKAEGAGEAQLAELQREADAIAGQRNTLFKGETLRGLLLTAFAWSTVGSIAGYAAIAAFAAAAVMVVLVALGIRHHHKVVTS
ncbi:MAG: hypothetical protein WA797_11620 [Acidimicrobiales bacterium]